MTSVVLVYFLCAAFVVVIYARLYSLSLENGSRFRFFVELVHPAMQVAMFISVLGVQGVLGQVINWVGSVAFALAAVPFLLNVLFALSSKSGKTIPNFLYKFDLGESVADSVIHAILCVGMAIMFLPHQAQSEWLNGMLTMVYAMFFGIYLLKFVEQVFLAPETNWPLSAKIVVHMAMTGSMALMEIWVHRLPNTHIH